MRAELQPGCGRFLNDAPRGGCAPAWRLPRPSLGREGLQNRSTVATVEREPPLALSGGVGAQHLRVVPPEPRVMPRRIRDHEHRCRDLEVLEEWPRVVEHSA